MSQFNDVKLDALKVLVSGVGNIADLEAFYLRNLTSTFDTFSREDLWKLYLDQQGIKEGALNDRKYEFFGIIGATADSLNEREIGYWQIVSTP